MKNVNVYIEEHIKQYEKLDEAYNNVRFCFEKVNNEKITLSKSDKEWLNNSMAKSFCPKLNMMFVEFKKEYCSLRGLKNFWEDTKESK